MLCVVLAYSIVALCARLGKEWLKQERCSKVRCVALPTNLHIPWSKAVLGVCKALFSFVLLLKFIQYHITMFRISCTVHVLGQLHFSDTVTSTLHSTLRTCLKHSSQARRDLASLECMFFFGHLNLSELDRKQALIVGVWCMWACFCIWGQCMVFCIVCWNVAVRYKYQCANWYYVAWAKPIRCYLTWEVRLLWSAHTKWHKYSYNLRTAFCWLLNGHS